MRDVCLLFVAFLLLLNKCLTFEKIANVMSLFCNLQIEKAEITERLADSPCALVASQYGWSGNMERIQRAQAYAKANDASQS